MKVQTNTWPNKICLWFYTQLSVNKRRKINILIYLFCKRDWGYGKQWNVISYNITYLSNSFYNSMTHVFSSRFRTGVFQSYTNWIESSIGKRKLTYLCPDGNNIYISVGIKLTVSGAASWDCSSALSWGMNGWMRTESSAAMLTDRPTTVPARALSSALPYTKCKWIKTL